MEALYLLIPVTLVLMVVIGAALFWAIRTGQFEDMEGPAHRILMEDDDMPDAGSEGPGSRERKPQEADSRGDDRR